MSWLGSGLAKEKEFINQEDHSMVGAYTTHSLQAMQQEVRAPESLSCLGKMPPPQQRNGEFWRGAALHFPVLNGSDR